MNDRYHNLLNHDKWNRRLMNVYWTCNAIILAVELVLMLVHFSGQNPKFPAGEYFFSFIFIPSSLIFLITASGEVAVRLLQKKHAAVLPYVIVFVCVAFCAVLLLVHYNVLGIYVIYVMPIFFSLVYGNKRVLLFTFLSSLITFIGIFFGYFNRFDVLKQSDYRLLYDLADALTNIAMLLAAYFVGTVILSRFGEVLDTVLEAERSASKAESEAQARSLFLANMSHEIRTPMNGVIGFTELALDNASLQDETKDFLRKIRISAEGLLGIIDGILDLSKIEAGRMELEKVPFSLGDVLRQCKIISSSGASEKALELRFRVDPITDKLLGDPTKLRQALLNLLSNAVKFTDKGVVELIVTADEAHGMMTVHFEVRDNGIGMTENQLQRIFDPFVQADDSTTRKYGGTGLGLSITKNIVELMGGCLKAESEPGFGSRFFFDLQFETAHQPDTAEENHTMAANEIAAFEGNILVCEDNDMNQQVISKHLSKFGLVPVIADNGSTGLEKFKKYAEIGQPFHLIFMDIHMPVMDGLEASRKLLELGCTAPIIALTANAMADDRSEYLKNGMSGCLVKPFVSAELYLCLKQYLKAADAHSLPELDRRPSADTWHTAKATDAIDRALGLESCAGSDQLYQKIRMDFLENGRAWNTALMDFIIAGDIDSAHRAAHTLSGRAAMLGASRLSNAAKKMEYALSKDGKSPRGDQTPPDESAPELETLASSLGREMSAVLNELAGIREFETVTC